MVLQGTRVKTLTSVFLSSFVLGNVYLRKHPTWVKTYILAGESFSIFRVRMSLTPYVPTWIPCGGDVMYKVHVDWGFYYWSQSLQCMQCFVYLNCSCLWSLSWKFIICDVYSSGQWWSVHALAVLMHRFCCTTFYGSVTSFLASS